MKMGGEGVGVEIVGAEGVYGGWREKMLRGGEGAGVEMVGEDAEGGSRCTEMGEDAEREGEDTAITIKLWITKTTFRIKLQTICCVTS